MKKSKILYEIVCLILTVALTAAGLWHAGNALLPEHYKYGSMWNVYLDEEKNSVDVLFFGSSLAYCDIVPAQIYGQTGIRSFVNAGGTQTLAVSRQYLEESLKTQTPSVAFLEISGAFYDQYMEFGTMNVIYMPAGLPRLRAGLACENDVFLSAVFPLYESHERIFLPAEERRMTPQNSERQAYMARLYAGFTFSDKSEPQTVTERSFTTVPGTETYENNLKDIRDFAEYCDKHGVRLVLYISPCMAHIPEAYRRQLFSDLADVPCIAMEDWTELSEQIGIDPETDWFDKLHMNVRGAGKFSAFLSDYLTQLGLTAEKDPQDSRWTERADWWRACCEACDIEISE